ncbi:MAG: DUF255 domain-containing protein [Stagnimonas sp.]|nr:DUF255 domain-containing protein [Stagnimonas sp.]
MSKILRIALTGWLLLCAAPLLAAERVDLPWRPFTPALFAQARAENKPVFLYLEAVWCHWCHVMQAKTFPDAGVQKRLGEQWLIASVDHDADPLLANRYRDYGWPALIFFNAQGQEVAKRAGFLSAADFSALLDAVVADPTPEQSAREEQVRAPPITTLPKDLRTMLEAAHRTAYDTKQGSLKLAQKYPDRDSVEYALTLAAAGDRTEARRARQTLDAARALIDPVWGGMYQYSTHGDWVHPHFEKIMRTQAGALRLYAQSYALTKNARDLRSANAIRDYLLNFLRDADTGAFHGTQDADAVPGEKAQAYFQLGDAARRCIGLPRIDPHLYAQENGLAIEALVALYNAGRDADTLCAATRAAQWALAHRALPDGRFAHEADVGLYLGDTLYMARAALALHGVTRDADWLAVAERAASAMALHFAAEGGGYLTAVAEGATLPPPRVTAENIDAARFYAALAKATGKAEYLADGRHALRWLALPEVAGGTLTEPGILLAADELAAAENAAH